MILAEEAVMHIARGIKVGMALVAADGAEKELAPFACNTLCGHEAEPHPAGSTTRTILRSSMCVDFHAHHCGCIGFFSRELVDFPFELVGLLAVQPSGLAASFWIDHSQAFKQEHTAWILLTHLDNGSCRLVCYVLMLPSNMYPHLLITSFSFDRFA